MGRPRSALTGASPIGLSSLEHRLEDTVSALGEKQGRDAELLVSRAFLPGIWTGGGKLQRSQQSPTRFRKFRLIFGELESGSQVC